MKRIHCGVIGLGWFGDEHVDALMSLPLAEVAAVCTRRRARLDEIASRHGIPAAYVDYRDLLADRTIEMVTIATHVKDHARIAIDALRAGKHVLLEKPMADTVEECDAILEEVSKTDKCFMVGHMCRFDTVYALAAEQIASGSIGRVLSIHARRNLAGSITAKVCQHISALFGDGVHDLDLALWYTGARPVSVYAQTMNTRNLLHDDLGWAMYRLSDESIVVIETVWCLPDNSPFAIDARMEIVGTDGAIYVDNAGGQYTLLTPKGLTYPQSTYWPRVHGMRRGYLKEELDYFLKCVAAGTKPTIVSANDSRAVVAAIRAPNTPRGWAKR